MKNNGLVLLAALFALFPSTALLAVENPLLKFVPSDTLFFSGNTQIIDIADYPMVSLAHSFEAPLSQSERQALGKGLAFFYELFLDFESTLQQGGQAMQGHYGLSPDIAAIIYSVGATPVIKLSLENEQALLSVLDAAEAKTGFEHKIEYFEQLEYRRYAINDNYQFIVNIQEQADGKKLATIALLSNTLADKPKKLIFGLMTPQPSIADTGKLDVIAQQNQYLPVSISFVDFQQLVKSLFQEKNNPWIDVLGDDHQAIVNLQASKCEADVMAIVQDMPRLIAGYKKYQVQGQQLSMDFEALLELKNQNVKTQLNYLRGFIPDYIRHGANEHILAFGLGANMSQLSPLFVYISRAFRESTFSCAALIEMQQEVAKFNPAMLALVTGVVDGVHGISFALQDIKLTPPKKISMEAGQNAAIATVDLSMILSLTAENPMKVWQMLAAFIPALASANPPIVPSEKPQRLNFPEFDTLGLDVFVALKGQHLVLYSGEKAAIISKQLTNEKIVTNGFFQESLNYSKLTTAVQEVRDYMSSANSPQPLPAEACHYFDESIALLSRMSGFIDFHSDFVSVGWLNTLTADITLIPPVKVNYQLPGKYATFNVQDGCQLAEDGREEILPDGSGFYQQYSEDGQCFIFETRYRWSQGSEAVNLQYLSERSRPEGACSNDFDSWSVPEPEYVNDACQLRTASEGSFACLYQWDDVLTKTVYKRI